MRCPGSGDMLDIPTASGLSDTLVYNHLDMGWGVTCQTRHGQSDTLDAH